MLVMQAVAAAIEGRRAEGIEAIQNLTRVNFHDPEGWYYWGRALARWNDLQPAIELLARAVDGGFHCARALETDPWLDTLRTTAAFRELVSKARAEHRQASRAFSAAGGERILGIIGAGLA
jgi:hypothetical protein